MFVYSLISKVELFLASLVSNIFKFGTQDHIHSNLKSEHQNHLNQKTPSAALFTNEASINRDWLILAHKLYKTVNAIKLVELQVPNLQLTPFKNRSMISQLHLIPHYKPLLTHILSLELKSKFNIDKVQSDSLSKREATYALRGFLLPYNILQDLPTTVLYFNTLNFINQKNFILILEQNLGSSKQNK